MSLADSSDYRVFTTQFDREVTAERLDTVIGRLSAADQAQLNFAWSEFQELLLASSGQLDSESWPVSSDAKGTIRAHPQNTVVTLLLDQSGSMRGRPMALAAVAIVKAVSNLAKLGCRVEVLGFTTVSWQGGRSRKRWKWRFRPKNPGRLCELLHVVYREPDDPRADMPDTVIKAMLRPDLPKDNIDGEAVLWASERLLTRREQRKILVVLGDGSPVDDSSQQTNGPLFLDEHLRDTIARIAADGRIELSAIGIGYDVSGWYPRTSTVQSAEDLAAGLMNFLEAVLGSRAEIAQTS